MIIWRYLLHGSDEMVMSKSWLADTERLARYDAYTRHQRDQGAIVSTPAQMAHAEAVAWRQRQAFWADIEARRAREAKPLGNVTTFRKVGR